MFEVQFTAGGYGWVVVHLERIERDELAELVFEAWRLTASARLRELRGERLPSEPVVPANLSSGMHLPRRTPHDHRPC